MTDQSLAGKQILVGVCGGIAAYKSPELVRRLRERGAVVRVVMTAAAGHFITPQSLQAVSGEPVRNDLWDESAEAAMGHIELARWADAIVVAPATADFIARLAAGLADDLLTTLCLATKARIWLAPSMNSVMWENAATRSNTKLLQERGLALVGPAIGDQACGEHGPGRMVEVTEIAETVSTQFDSKSELLAGSHVVITAGPTRERIDPVRFISNYSSGKMGFALARAAVAAGARVTLIAGPVALDTPVGVERIDVESAAQMQRAVHQVLGSETGNRDIFVSTAAVADHRPLATAAHKIKKNTQGESLALEPTPDILAGVAALADRPFCVGFAAETREVEKYAQQKLAAKSLDMIVANRVGEADGKPLAFGTDDNELLVLWPGGRKALPRASKLDLARDLVELIAKRTNDNTRERKTGA